MIRLTSRIARPIITTVRFVSSRRADSAQTNKEARRRVIHNPEALFGMWPEYFSKQAQTDFGMPDISGIRLHWTTDALKTRIYLKYKVSRWSVSQICSHYGLGKLRIKAIIKLKEHEEEQYLNGELTPESDLYCIWMDSIMLALRDSFYADGGVKTPDPLYEDVDGPLDALPDLQVQLMRDNIHPSQWQREANPAPLPVQTTPQLNMLPNRAHVRGRDKNSNKTKFLFRETGQFSNQNFVVRDGPHLRIAEDDEVANLQYTKATSKGHIPYVLTAVPEYYEGPLYPSQAYNEFLFKDPNGSLFHKERFARSITKAEMDALNLTQEQIDKMTVQDLYQARKGLIAAKLRKTLLKQKSTPGTRASVSVSKETILSAIEHLGYVEVTKYIPREDITRILSGDVQPQV